MLIHEPTRILVDERANPRVALTLMKRRGYKRFPLSCGHGHYVAHPSHLPSILDGTFCGSCQHEIDKQEVGDLEKENIIARTLIADAGEHRRALSVRIDCTAKTVVLGKGRVVVGYVRRIDQTVRSSMAIPISVNKLLVVDVLGRHWSAWVPLDNWHRGLDAYALLIPRALPKPGEEHQEADNVVALPRALEP